jgi:hypothetical protein
VLVGVLAELAWLGDVLADLTWPPDVHAGTIAAASTASSND